MVYHTRPAGNLAYSQYLKLLVAWLEMTIQEMTFTLSKGTHRLCVDVGQAANKSSLLLASSENPIREIGAKTIEAYFGGTVHLQRPKGKGHVSFLAACVGGLDVFISGAGVSSWTSDVLVPAWFATTVSKQSQTDEQREDVGKFLMI